MSLAVSPLTGCLVVASGSEENTVRLWDAETAVSSSDTSAPIVCNPTTKLRWTSRASGQPLDATGVMLSPSVDCGLQPHQLKLLQHFGMSSPPLCLV